MYTMYCQYGSEVFFDKMSQIFWMVENFIPINGLFSAFTQNRFH